MWARNDKRKSIKNVAIAAFCATTEYKLLDIVQNGEVKLILECPEHYHYKVTWRRFSAGKIPRFKLTTYNVKQVCINNGVEFVENLNAYSTGNLFKIKYKYRNRVYEKNFYTLKDRGHIEDKQLHFDNDEYITYTTDQQKILLHGICKHHGSFDVRYYGKLDMYCPTCREEGRLATRTRQLQEKAVELGVVFHKYINGCVTYTCCNDHINTTTSGIFMHKTTAQCGICTQISRLAYHSGNIHKYRDIPGYLYIIELSGADEQFIKIGITVDPKKRFNGITQTYNVDKAYLFPFDMFTAYTLEQVLHGEFKAYSYTPHTKFTGYTECFKLPTKDVIDEIEELQCLL